MKPHYATRKAGIKGLADELGIHGAMKWHSYFLLAKRQFYIKLCTKTLLTITFEWVWCWFIIFCAAQALK